MVEKDQLSLHDEQGWGFDQRDPNKLAKGLLKLYALAKERQREDIQPGIQEVTPQGQGVETLSDGAEIEGPEKESFR